LTNNSIANVTAYNAAIATGGMKLISSQTASNSASISFTTGLDSTYKEYQFWFVNLHASADNSTFQFNISTDGGSNYNVVKTTTIFRAFQYESGAETALDYQTGHDLAQSTAFQDISIRTDTLNDSSISGNMTIFNPSSTTYVKHFMSVISTNVEGGGEYALNNYMAGYGNTTSAINAIQFKMASGNIDDGTILMYGIV
jgi:hypothetical protein